MLNLFKEKINNDEERKKSDFDENLKIKPPKDLKEFTDKELSSVSPFLADKDDVVDEVERRIENKVEEKIKSEAVSKVHLNVEENIITEKEGDIALQAVWIKDWVYLRSKVLETPKKYLSPKEVLRMYAIRKTTLYKHIKTWEIERKPFRVNNSEKVKLLISKKSLERFLWYTSSQSNSLSVLRTDMNTIDNRLVGAMSSYELLRGDVDVTNKGFKKWDKIINEELPKKLTKQVKEWLQDDINSMVSQKSFDTLIKFMIFFWIVILFFIILFVYYLYTINFF